MSSLGIDVGTTGCKVIGFDEKGHVIAQAYREYPLYQPQEGWMELDAEEVFRSVEECLLDISGDLQSDPPVSIGISAQGEAVVPVDSSGKPLSRSMVTFDKRGEEFVPLWKEKVGEAQFFQITGMPLSGIGTVNKILWWKKYLPEVFEKARFFLCFEDFIMFRMGVGPAMNYSLAGRTMMFDVKKAAWSKDILDLAGIDPKKLADTVPSGKEIGLVSPSFQHKMGWREKVMIAGGAHDQPSGALGSGVIRSHLAMDATGTVECIAPVMPELLLTPLMRENNLCCYHHSVENLYITLVYTFSGGAVLRWYRDTFAAREKEQAQLQGKDVYDFILKELPAGPTNLLVLPHFTTTGTPYFDTKSCGMIVGLKVETTAKEIIKALLEGISFEMKFNLELLGNAGVQLEALRAIGGGAKNPTWLQIKADVYDLPVETLNISEAACLGAALLGRKAREKITDFSALVNSIVRVKKVYEPNPANVLQYQDKFGIFKRLYPALKQVIRIEQ
ncbi:MAG: FGGY family carbohydrate kinase [Candidatus Atribacteria bacterium]|nr:FGGY family carbohydrate kinase [Candidatus Atribacteria bacterium]